MKGTITLCTSHVSHKYYNNDVEKFVAMGFTYLPEKSYQRPTDRVGMDCGITLDISANSAEKVLELIAFATQPGKGYKVEKCVLEKALVQRVA